MAKTTSSVLGEVGSSTLELVNAVVDSVTGDAVLLALFLDLVGDVVEETHCEFRSRCV